MNRPHPCRQLLAGALALLAGISHAAEPRVGSPLPAWQPGELDIHHIHTGRGDALLFVLPDGTSLLNDAAGRRVEQAPFSFPTRPDASRAPGEWIARYVRRALPAGAQGLDYALLSHFHGDHIGVVDDNSPTSRHGGDYRLAGITEVAEHVPIARLIDRAWPDYRAPGVPDNPTMANSSAGRGSSAGWWSSASNPAAMTRSCCATNPRPGHSSSCATCMPMAGCGTRLMSA